MSCNPRLPWSSTSTTLFQSLSGFPMSCNPDFGTVHRDYAVFQSLSGFPMSCNFEHGPILDVETACVSIPIGFSNELQLVLLGVIVALGGVSIPIGFSNELQLTIRCRDGTILGPVSIPIGFSNELQPDCRRQPLRSPQFQSLSGFPMSCNGGASARR